MDWERGTERKRGRVVFFLILVMEEGNRREEENREREIHKQLYTLQIFGGGVERTRAFFFSIDRSSEGGARESGGWRRATARGKASGRDRCRSSERKETQLVRKAPPFVPLHFLLCFHVFFFIFFLLCSLV